LPAEVVRHRRPGALLSIGLLTTAANGLASRRKPPAAGAAAVPEIRSNTDGDATSVNQLVLELPVRSRDDIQRAHRILAQYATAVTLPLLQAALPVAGKKAVLRSTSVRWSDDDGADGLRLTIA
jgi:hypothetical protein